MLCHRSGHLVFLFFHFSRERILTPRDSTALGTGVLMSKSLRHLPPFSSTECFNLVSQHISCGFLFFSFKCMIICVCAPHACLVPTEVRRRWQEWDPGSLQEQQALLTAEPSLQPRTVDFKERKIPLSMISWAPAFSSPEISSLGRLPLCICWSVSSHCLW